MNAYRTVILTVIAAALASPLASAQSQTTNDSVRMRFRAMDTDSDGVVTRAEWRGSDQAFREQDANADGVLSGDEVRVRAGETPAAPDRNRRGQFIARFER